MSTIDIRTELETRLKTWADSKSPKVQIAFQNVAFTKPVGLPFLECILIPNTTVNNEISGTRKTHLGLFQVNCWAPKGAGMRQAESLAQSVSDLYPILPKTGSVSIEQTPSIGRGILDDSGWIIVPVLIKYRHEAV